MYVLFEVNHNKFEGTGRRILANLIYSLKQLKSFTS